MTSHLGKRIWILEDQPDLRTVLTYLAQKKGYLVKAFSCLKEAWFELAEAVHLGMSPDFVISDLQLEDGNAENWLLEVRDSFPSARLLCFSGSLEPVIIERLRIHNIIPWEKPSSLSQILEVLNENARMNWRQGRSVIRS